jgi:hypothetical protein
VTPPVCQDVEQKLDLETTETNAKLASAPAAPMNAIWRTIRGYILWSYERGSIQYDIMVTVILMFVFLSPYWINFKDKPVERNPHPTGVVVVPDTAGGFVYQIEGSAVTGKEDAAIRAELLRIIEPISGEVNITRYETIRDRSGRISGYKVWAQKE